VSLFAADTPRDTIVAWAFVIVQLVLLVLIVLLPSGDLWTVPAWLDLVARVLEWVGAAVLVVGLVNLGRSLTPLPSPVPHGELRTGGLFRLVRHPIYSGIMALTIGVAIRSGSLGVVAATAVLVGWFMLKARWEEARLAVRYPGYSAYAARTPRFVPFWPV
jgi:protein-S-isoprenylcysteine O-methyltransferase Ste14